MARRTVRIRRLSLELLREALINRLISIETARAVAKEVLR